MKTITLTTLDHYQIVGDYAAKSGPAVLFLPMMPAVRSSYDQLAHKLQFNGFTTLSIDFRGHGESQEGPDGYQKYTDPQHQESYEDVKAALAFLAEKGHSEIIICGASIGANLALRSLAKHPEVTKVILLSPGLDYRGIKGAELARKVPVDKEILIVAAKDDLRSYGAADLMAQEIAQQLSCKKELKIYTTGGHGTELFGAHPELMEELVRWLKR